MVVERLGRLVTFDEITPGTCVAFSFGDTTYAGLKLEWQAGGQTSSFIGSLYPGDPDLRNIPGLYESGVFTHVPLYELPNLRISMPVSLSDVHVNPNNFPRAPGQIYLTEKHELAIVLRYANRNIAWSVNSGTFISSAPPVAWFSKWQMVYSEGDQREVIFTFEPRTSS